MPRILPGDTAPRGKGQVHKKRVEDVVDVENRIAAAEESSLGVVPTSLVYAGALSATDDKEAAKWTALIARQLDLPVPPAYARNKKKKNPPKQLVDPYTGKAISVSRANTLFGFGQSIATQLVGYRPHGGYRPPDPELTSQYVSALKLLPDLSAEVALSFSMDMSRTQTPIERFRGNLSVINGWNKDTGTVSDEEALVYARYWAEHKDRPITPADLVTLTDPELTAAIHTLKGEKAARDRIATRNFPNATPQVTSQDLDRLIAAREKALSNPNYIRDAQNILGQIEAPTVADKVIAFGTDKLEDLWHTTQHIFVDVSTIPVGIVDQAQAALPGGQTLGDAFRETQHERQYIIQRINAGESVGHIYADKSFLPEWSAPAFDFAVGWAFDPFRLGGGALTGVRAARVLGSGVIEAPGFGGKVAEAVATLREGGTENIINRFAGSTASRRLYEAAYKGDDSTQLFRQIDNLATHFEARSAMEYEYMDILRRGIREQFPRGGEEAWAEWQNAIRSHFGVQPQTKFAAGIVGERLSLSKGAEENLLRSPIVSNGTRYVEREGGLLVPERTAVGLADEVIDRGTTALALRNEVPHQIIPISPTKLGRAFRQSRLGQTEVGRGLAALPNPNPGNVFRPGVDPEIQIIRRGTRWREFTEPELRAYQSRAVGIFTSGQATERRLVDLVKEMDGEALARIAAKEGIEDPQALVKAIQGEAYREPIFGTLTERATSGAARSSRNLQRPVLESQLVDQVVTMDPILARKMVRRVKGTLDEMDSSIGKVALAAGKTKEAAYQTLFKVSDLSQELAREATRFWKFMVVPRPAYIFRVVLGDENLRFLATSSSLVDRLLAQEWKPLKGLLDKLSTKIKVGDDVIEIPRAGAQSYEPAAAMAFRQEDAIDDMFNQSNLGFSSLKSTGEWGRVEATAKQHLPAWERVLNFQIGQSVPGRRALQSIVAGETLEETRSGLINWARKDGYVTLRSRIGVDPADVNEWADDLAKMTHAYTMGDGDIARAALARTVNRDILSAIPIGERPAVHGPLVESITGAGGNHFAKRVADKWYKWTLRQPEDVLNRQPYYKLWKSRAEEMHYNILAKQGVELTDDIKGLVEAQSREFALAQVRKIMFDFTQQARVAEMAGMVVPFAQPWAEAFQVWGHILVHRNPGFIGSVNQMWRLGRESGFIQKDEDGNYNVPWSWTRRAMSWLPFVGRPADELPPGVGLVANMTSFNLFFSSQLDVGGVPIPFPSPSPAASLVLKKIFDQTDNPTIASYLFDYGKDTAFFSSWFVNEMRFLRPEQFTDQRQDAVAMEYLRYYQYIGTDKDENGNPIPERELIARAKQDAQNTNGMLGFIGLIAPTAGRISFPEEYQEKEAELDQLRNSLGFEAGTDRFLQKYPELSLLTIGKTITTAALDGIEAPRVPTSENVAKLLKKPGFEEFARNNTWAAAALVLGSDEQWDESSLRVFSDFVSDKQIKYKSLARFITEGESAGMWDAISALNDVYYPKLDQLNSKGLSDDNQKVIALKRARAEGLYDILLRYPDAAKRSGIVADPNKEGQATWLSENVAPSELVHQKLRSLTTIDGFENFPAIQGLKAYYDVRDNEILPAMREAGIDDITSTTAERAGLTEKWDTALTRIQEQFPEAEPFISKFLDNDLTGVESKADRTIRLMQTNNPDRYAEFQQADTELERLSDKASNANTSDQRTFAYNRVREYIDTLYETKSQWKLDLWYQSKSASAREQYMAGLQARPPVFYSRYDWHLMGLDLSEDAAAVLSEAANARQNITVQNARELRGQRGEFLSGQAYENIDIALAREAKKDPSLAKAVTAMRQWGWGLWQSDWVDQKGKAGWAWRNLRDTVVSLNNQVIQIGMHGPDSFDSADYKQAYVQARDALLDRINEYRKWSPVFDEQVSSFQRGSLRGSPFVEWLMPDEYYPIGVVGDD